MGRNASVQDGNAGGNVAGIAASEEAVAGGCDLNLMDWKFPAPA